MTYEEKIKKLEEAESIILSIARATIFQSLSKQDKMNMNNYQKILENLLVLQARIKKNK